jgi:hypothetical protein
MFCAIIEELNPALFTTILQLLNVSQPFGGHMKLRNFLVIAFGFLVFSVGSALQASTTNPAYSTYQSPAAFSLSVLLGLLAVTIFCSQLAPKDFVERFRGWITTFGVATILASVIFTAIDIMFLGMSIGAGVFLFCVIGARNSENEPKSRPSKFVLQMLRAERAIEGWVLNPQMSNSTSLALAGALCLLISAGEPFAMLGGWSMAITGLTARVIPGLIQDLSESPTKYQPHWILE